MPKLLRARPPADVTEERQIRKLARSRHAPADWIRRARMIMRSWDGLRTTAIARELQCHPQTVRERLIRFNAEGLDGLGDHPGPGRKPRLTEAERSIIVGLVATQPPGRCPPLERRGRWRRSAASDVSISKAATIANATRCGTRRSE